MTDPGGRLPTIDRENTRCRTAGEMKSFPAASGSDGAGESCLEIPLPILTAAFLSAMRRRQRVLACVLGAARNADPSTARRSIPAAGGKIQGLPNNRTNEMIRGCEIRSISGGPPPRPLHEAPVEHRFVVHGFRRR